MAVPDGRSALKNVIGSDSGSGQGPLEGSQDPGVAVDSPEERCLVQDNDA